MLNLTNEQLFGSHEDASEKESHQLDEIGCQNFVDELAILQRVDTCPVKDKEKIRKLRKNLPGASLRLDQSSDPAPFEVLGCVTSNLFSLNDPNQVARWIESMNLLSRGASGRTYTGLPRSTSQFRECPFLIKVFNLNSDGVHEAFVGIFGVNKMRTRPVNLVPNFVFTYGMTFLNEPYSDPRRTTLVRPGLGKRSVYLFAEYVP